MIRLTRLNGTRLIINALLIERIETTPDTVIRLTTGTQYVVKESANEIQERSVNFLRSIRSNDPRSAPAAQLARMIK